MRFSYSLSLSRVLCTSRCPVPPCSDPPSGPSPERRKAEWGGRLPGGTVGGDWGACHPSPFQTQSSNLPASVFPQAPPPRRCSRAHSLHTSQMLWFSVGCSVSLQACKADIQLPRGSHVWDNVMRSQKLLSLHLHVPHSPISNHHFAASPWEWPSQGVSSGFLQEALDRALR